MNMRKPHKHLLLVEGEEDKRVLPQLLEKCSIPWGEKNERDKWPADIIEGGGIERLLEAGVIEGYLKSPGLEALGVIVDANSNPIARWQSIRSRAIGSMPTIPEHLPGDGLIMENNYGLRFGLWIMPDCSSRGMLETFLSLFINDQTATLWDYLKTHCNFAKLNHHAPFKDNHRDKALIHAWLALQNPPGQQLHSAIIQNILKPNSPYADSFLNWFRKLYRV